MSGMPAGVAQISKSAVSQASKPVCGVTASGFGNPRYGGFGNLRYEKTGSLATFRYRRARLPNICCVFAYPSFRQALNLASVALGICNGSGKERRRLAVRLALAASFINTPLQRGVGAAGAAETVLTVLSSRHFNP